MCFIVICYVLVSFLQLLKEGQKLSLVDRQLLKNILSRKDVGYHSH